MLPFPQTDPTPIFEAFRGAYATELLTAAVAEFRMFDLLAEGPMAWEELQARLGLDDRPMQVLTTALRGMKVLERRADGRLELSLLGREHLTSDSPFDVGDYVRLAAHSPGVREMVERLRTNRPAGAAPKAGVSTAEAAVESGESVGVAFVYREGEKSAMEAEASARFLTLSLAGRAKNVAPYLAERAPLENARRLLDVGGGSGLYAVACLLRRPQLQAVVWDRPEVLRVAREMAEAHGVSDRLECRPGDMFVDPVPMECDAVLLSNVLHDWDVPECRKLVSRCAAALPSGGRLLIHDVLLDDDHGGPLPVALYSAALFTLTEGRAYSEAEYHAWLLESGLTPEPSTPTLVHCHLLPGVK